ncbi:BSD domain-containing protein [Sporobolomyces salmoneus]|uniref:BSD domain-containing protein n=1 Tax=Sporobolomyces salmoneus TaxID=183962 RepID=UPI0031792102
MESLGGFIDPSLSTSRPSTPTSSATPSSSTSADPSSSSARATAMPGETTLDLDNEVKNVIAGFGSFWGKVRKQSTAALANAEKQLEATRKDLNPLLSKAKANLDQFSVAARAEVQRLSEVQTTSGEGSQAGVVIGADGLPMIVGGNEETKKLDKGKGVDRSPVHQSALTSTLTDQAPAAAASDFFSKLQSQFSSTQTQALSSLSSNFTQIQDQLSQLNTSTVAEEYLHKGEHWLSEFREEVSKLAKEAVQVVPPPSSTPSSTLHPSKSSSSLTSMKGLSRKDTLLYRLGSDPEILLVDPALPPLPSSTDLIDLRSSYSTFISSLPSSENLLESDLVKDAKDQGGELLEETKRKVIESESEASPQVSEEEFWKRYLFRVHLIEEEEEKRKKVLSVTQSEDEDFTWDIDEDDEPSTSTPHPPSLPSLVSTASQGRTVVSDPARASSGLETTSKEPVSLSEPSSPSSEAEPTRLPSASQRVETVHGVRTPSSSSEESQGTRTSYDFVGERSGNPSIDGENEPRQHDEVEKVEREKGEVEEEEEEEEDSDWE